MTATINIDGRKVESDRVAKNRQSRIWFGSNWPLRLHRIKDRNKEAGVSGTILHFSTF
jgi:hypothetical protein